MSGFPAAPFACAVPCDQCGPNIGGSFLFGFLFTSWVVIASWAVSANAHNSKAANESHFIFLFPPNKLGRSETPRDFPLVFDSCQCGNRRIEGIPGDTSESGT